MRPSQIRLAERRRLHAVYASDLRLGRKGWDWPSQLVYVLAWCGLVTVCVAFVAVGAGLGYVLWWAARAVFGGNGW